MGVISRIIDFYKLQIEVLWKWRPGRRALLRRAIVSLICGTISLLLTVALLPGIRVQGWPRSSLR